MNGQTIAVTGISGFFGQVLLPRLEQDAGIERVIGIDRRPPDENPVDGKVSFHQLDVRSPQLEELLVGVDVVVHLAYVMLPTPKQRETEVEEINVQGTQAVCRAAARHRVRKLVIPSSVMAYGLHPDNPIPLTEDMPLRPNRDNIYSRTKAINERFLDRFVDEHPEMLVTRLRPSTVVGPHGPRGQMAPIVYDPVLIVRGGDPPYQLLYEEDMAQALHLAIQQDIPGVYNVASDEPRRTSEMVDARDGRTLALPYFVIRGLLQLMWRLGYSDLSAEWADLMRYPLLVSNDKLKAQGWQPQYTTPQAYRALYDAFHREENELG